jgi:hypothetical protein
MAEKVVVELNDTQLMLLDKLQPFFGETREKVIKYIMTSWIEQNIGTEKIAALRQAGVIS